MSLQGNLNGTNLQEILQEFSLNRTTGKLVLEKESETGFIFLSNGLIASACSPKAFRFLEDTLLKEIVIEPKIWEQILNEEERLNNDGIILKLLEAKGVISSNVYSNLMERQTQIALFDLLSWEKGTYNFIRKTPPTGLLALHVEHLLMEWLHYQEEEADKHKKSDTQALSKSGETIPNADLALLRGLEKDLSDKHIEIAEESIVNLDSLKQILDLFSGIEKVTYACLISRDGLYHGYESDKFEFPYSVGALAANMWGMIDSFANELLKDERLKSIYLKFDEHIVIFYLLNENLSLMLIAEYGVDIEYIKWLSLKTKENIFTLINDF